MDYHPHVKGIRPTVSWNSGVSETLLVVITDLTLPSSPEDDGEDFSSLRKWVETYRSARYPGFRVEYRNA